MDKFAERQDILKLLNAPTEGERLENLKKILAEETEKPKVRPEYANNHIHTIYSFSPYSPTAAIYCARDEGLETAGIMDHDTIAGAEEFRKAGQIAGIGTTCGMECRANLKGTRLEGRKLNNPDQAGIAYMTIHSVPAPGFKRLSEVFASYRKKRNIRNRRMVESINKLMAPYGIEIDFDRDVVPISQYENGGTITERHLLYALSLKIIAASTADFSDECPCTLVNNGEKFIGKDAFLPPLVDGLSEATGNTSLPPLARGGAGSAGGGVVNFVQNKLGILLNEKTAARLSDPKNPHLSYDLLGVLKAELVERIYIPATDECIPIKELVKISDEVGAILCYAYLGDVADSVTGDKKAAKFEDDFLDDLFDMLKEEGIRALTYMPARNTREQIIRVQALCKKYGMQEISGEDVNSSRQSMICEQLTDPLFKHLVNKAWELVNREKIYPV